MIRKMAAFALLHCFNASLACSKQDATSVKPDSKLASMAKALEQCPVANGRIARLGTIGWILILTLWTMTMIWLRS
jgi:hypothetical protein